MKVFDRYMGQIRRTKDIKSLQEIERRTQLLISDLQRELSEIESERAHEIFKI